MALGFFALVRFFWKAPDAGIAVIEPMAKIIVDKKNLPPDSTSMIEEERSSDR